jgi:uroporphyrinogen III methyltransferase/synthase
MTDLSTRGTAMNAEAGAPGIVYLVGAGPGDEGLVAVRGIEALQRAGVVVYDYLASPLLLEHCRVDCEKLYVGKSGGEHTLPQGEINALLVERARRGQTVVRLKGGDPFVFGRGGEEALELARNGIPFVVVPGITAALGAAAYAGIPLTHRRLASTAVLITGHEDPEKEASDVDWGRLAPGAGTLAVYMGVKNLRRIIERILAAGRPAGTPAALIRWGTLEKQETLSGTLQDIVDLAEARGFGPPAVLVVGEVVALRQELRWFDNRPLFGRRVVVTRARSQASQLSRGLRELGAEVRELPTIDIAPLEDQSGLDKVFAQLASFAWIVFTSTNAVEIFFSRLAGQGLDSRTLAGVQVAAMGPETAGSLQRRGIRADLVPERFTSEAVLENFAARRKDYRGQRFLFPGSEIAREVLPAGLENLGAEVVRLATYRNRVPRYSVEQIDELFTPLPDLVAFTSSSTVAHLAEILRASGRQGLLSKVRGACIGPVTAATAREHGVSVQVESGLHTIPGLIQAIEEHYRERRKA